LIVPYTRYQPIEFNSYANSTHTSVQFANVYNEVYGHEYSFIRIYRVRVSLKRYLDNFPPLSSYYIYSDRHRNDLTHMNEDTIIQRDVTGIMKHGKTYAIMILPAKVRIITRNTNSFTNTIQNDSSALRLSNHLMHKFTTDIDIDKRSRVVKGNGYLDLRILQICKFDKELGCKQ
jgi:hypothetical protein